MRQLAEGHHLRHASVLGDRLDLIFEADNARKATAFVDLNVEELRMLLAEVAKSAPHLLHQALEERLIDRIGERLIDRIGDLVRGDH